MEQYTILIADDDELIIGVLKRELEREAYGVLCCYDGEEALQMARREKPDLILLDAMMPKKSGWEVCRELRAETTTPILMLSARGDEMDMVMGLKVGADDYIAKPFGLLELLARIDANLRRAKIYERTQPLEEQKYRVQFGNLSMDLERCLIIKDEKSISLTSKEFDLLRAFMMADGAVISRNELLDQVWGEDWIGDTRTLDVHVSRLRQKLENDPAYPRLILTIRGIGYRMRTVDEFETCDNE